MIDIRHWLLDAAVEFAIPLRIVGAPNVGEILNRKPHGLASEDLANCLLGLVESGAIEFCRHFDQQAHDSRPNLSKDAIVRLLTEDRWAKSLPCSYRLTSRGGAEWEDWAKPQWSRYARICSWDNFSEIGAASLRVANELLELEDHILRECAIIPGSIRRRVFDEWQATYWKTLPKVHLIAFRTRALPEAEWRPAPDGKWARWVELSKFYLRPTDCGF